MMRLERLMEGQPGQPDSQSTTTIVDDEIRLLNSVAEVIFTVFDIFGALSVSL